MFVDSHCHLAMLEPADRRGVLERARESGVRGFLVPATRADDFGPTLDAARGEENVWCALGVHPHDAITFADPAETSIRSAAGDRTIVAVGEIGLDFHYDHSPREVQREVLRRQITIARDCDLPVIVHNRESTADLIAILREEGSAGVRGVIHSFTEDAAAAREFLDLGFLISFSGIVTFRSAEALRDAARHVPLDSMLIETDSPFLAPVPMRGKQNEPSFIRHTAQTIADCHGVDVETVGERTSANFQRLFRVELA